MPTPLASASWTWRAGLTALLLISVSVLAACSADDETRIVLPAEISVAAGTRLEDQGSTPRAGLLGPDRPYGRRTPFVPLDNPSVLTAPEASYLEDEDLVLGLLGDGTARVYPIRMLTFEVFGLQADVFTMIDRETGTIWTHFDGKAFEGPLDGVRMGFVLLPQMTWAEWKKPHPETEVLSPDTPFAHRYVPVRIGRFSRSEDRFGDDRLESNALLVGVEVADRFKGYPVKDVLRAGGVVNDVLADSAIVVMYDPRARAGLAYFSVVDGPVLHFYNAAGLEGFELRDEETGSAWDSLGRAVVGPMAGAVLQFVPSFITEWYGWSEYHPETDLSQASP